MNRGEIWLSARPSNSGHVQQGVHPALIVIKSTSHLVTVVPITSSLNAARFQHAVTVEPTPMNGLARKSVLLVHQMGALDTSFLIKKIGVLDNNTLQEVMNEVRAFLE